MAPHPLGRADALPLVLALAALVGGILQFVGVTPWLLVLATIALVALAAAQWMPADLAIASAVSGMLAGFTLLVRIAPALGIHLAAANLSALVLLSAAAVVILVLRRRRSQYRGIAWRSARPLLWGLAPIVAFFTVLFVAISVTGGQRLQWAMQNDAVWNTMSARQIWEDGGVSALHPNPSPLTSALMASAFAPGRDGLDPALLLEHDVTRQAQLWLLLVLATCILAGVIAYRALGQLAPVARGFAIFGVAVIPASWYAAGYAFQFGFYNVTTALVLLLCAWIGWTSAREARTRAIVVLALTSVATLATWAPLAIVPVALIVAALITAGRAWWQALPGPRLVVLAVAAIVVVGYALVATLPDLVREGGALAAEGAMFALGPRHVLITTGATIVAVVVAAIVRKERWAAYGVAAVVVSAGIVLGYLVLQRRGLESIWGYYPAKFAWLVLILLIIVLAVSLLGWATGPAVRAVGVLLATGVVVGALTSNPLPTRDSLTAIPTIIAPAALDVDATGPPLLFSLSDPREKNLVADYSVRQGTDNFVNNWLLQQAATDAKDPIRGYAYLLDPTDVGQLCAVADLWGPGVVVRSTDPSLAAAIDDTCPAAGVSVDLH